MKNVYFGFNDHGCEVDVFLVSKDLMHIIPTGKSIELPEDPEALLAVTVCNGTEVREKWLFFRSRVEKTKFISANPNDSIKLHPGFIIRSPEIESVVANSTTFYLPVNPPPLAA